ncbi:hypothetical protein V8E51_002769 [Hyaloscypha variabilis]
MRNLKELLLQEVYYQKVVNDRGIIIVHAPSVEPEKNSNRPVRWEPLLRLLSPYDTRVYVLQNNALSQESFAQLLARSRGLLRELFTVHLKDQDLHRPVVFICDGTGGLLVKEAIAFAGEEPNEWQSKLNNILHITFLGTPHFGDLHDAHAPYPIEKRPTPYDTLSMEEISQLHLSASQFVETFRRIDSTATILSGYEQPSPKKSMFKRVTFRGRPKSTVITMDQACIGIPEENIELMDTESHQIFNSSCDSSFRNIITKHIRDSVEAYRRSVERISISSPTDGSTTNSSERECARALLGTPSSSSGLPSQELRNLNEPSNSSSPHRQPKRPTFPFVYPKNSILQGPPYFQPRLEISSALERSLLPSQEISSSNSNLLTYIITGLGGVGKTEVVRHFAAEHQKKFDAIFFVIADQRERLSQQYAEIASSLSLVDPESRQNPDPEDDREKLKSWLENPVKVPGSISEIPSRLDGKFEEKAKWLLILDNADNPQVLDDFWPRSGFGSVLVTSRDPSIGVQIYPSSDRTILGSLPVEDAISLLKRLTWNEDGAQDVDNAAKAIAERLEGLPLAIDQIGSVIIRRRLSLPEFVQDYVRASGFHKLYNERRITNGYEHSLGSVWAFDSLEEEDKPAFSLLSVLSMLDPACIQEEVMLKTLGSNAINHYPRFKTDYNDALAGLLERSMVHKDRESGSLHLHRLVQEVTRARLARDNQELTDAFAISWKAISACFPRKGFLAKNKLNAFGTIERWQKCSTMFTHVVHVGRVAWELLQTQNNLKFSPEFVELLYEAAWWQCERREVGESQPLVDLAMTICELRSPNGESVHENPAAFEWHLVSLWACRIFAAQTIGDGKTAFHFSQMRCKNAEDEYKRTGILRPFLPATYNDLAQSYAMNRLYDKALSYLEKSVELMKQLPNFKKDWLCSPYYRIAITNHCLGKFEEAAETIEEAITDRETEFGQNDRLSSRTGLLYYILGNIRNSQGRLDELAEHYMRCNYDDEARTYLQNILHTCGERTDRRREVAQAAFVLSELLQRQGEIDKSHKMREKVAGIYGELRPGNKKTAKFLTSSDVLGLTTFDCF